MYIPSMGRYRTPLNNVNIELRRELIQVEESLDLGFMVIKYAIKKLPKIRRITK